MITKIIAPVATGTARAGIAATRSAANVGKSVAKKGKDSIVGLNPLKQPPSQIQSFRQNSSKIKPAANDSNYEKQTGVLENINDSIKDKPDDDKPTDYLKSIDSKIGTQITIDQAIEKNTGENIAGKLSVLSDRLNSKYAAANDDTPIRAEDTTSSSLSDNDTNSDLNSQTPTSVSERLVPKKEKSSNGLLENDGKSGKELTSIKNPLSIGIDKVGSAIKTGFKSSVSAVDKVTGFLFKMSLSQAVEAAKTAAAIFAIILAIDVIRIYWEKWGESIIAKLTEWAEIFKGWWDTFTNWASQFASFTTAFETMGANLMAIRNAWENGDFPALAKAIGGAIIDLAKTIAVTIGRVVASVIASALRKFGFNEVADDVEAQAIRNQQNLTDNRLSPEEQKKLAENQVKKEEKDGKTTTERGVTDFLPNSWRKNLGLISDNEYKQIEKEKKDQKTTSGLTHDEKVKNVMATNEAREAVSRYKKYADAANPTNKNDMAKVDKYKKEAEGYLKSEYLSLTPETKTELTNQYNAIKVKPAPVKPAPSNENKDVQTAKSIKQNESAKPAGTSGNTTANIQNNIVKNNKSVVVQSPVTSTRAPGVFKATGVN